MDFSKLTEKELRSLEIALSKERGRRQELEFKMNNECPDCFGSGYTGSELDHYPCERCKTTGRYIKLPQSL